MRITTQMLNESFRKAGLPIHQASLMDYINKPGGGGSSLADIMPVKQTGAENKAKYEKREKAADTLLEQIQKFAEEGEKSIFGKSEASGDASELHKEAEKFVENYNSLLSDLYKGTETLDAFYAQNMRELVSSEKDLLAEVGITAEKDGKLKIDHDKLKNASVEKMKEVFGEKSEFMEKLQFLAGRVSDLASANLKNASGNYSPSGNMNYYTPNKYNFWG